MDVLTYRIGSDQGVTQSEPIHLTALDDVVNGPPLVAGTPASSRSETVSVYGHAAQFLRLTPAAGVTALKDYPDDGAATVPDFTSTATTIRLAADAPAFGLGGLLVLMLSGAGIGQVRWVADYDTATKLVTCDRNWDAGYVPGLGDAYRLLVPGFWRSEWHVKVEFANAQAIDPALSLVVALYDYPQTPPTTGANKGKLGVVGTGRASRRFCDREVIIDNLDLTTDSTQAGYRQGRTESGSTRGAVGFKVRPTPTQQPTGAFALYGCAT